MRKLLGALGGGGKGSSGDKAKKKVIRANLGDDNSFYYDEKVRARLHGSHARRDKTFFLANTNEKCLPLNLIFLPRKKKPKRRNLISCGLWRPAHPPANPPLPPGP